METIIIIIKTQRKRDNVVPNPKTYSSIALLLYLRDRCGKGSRKIARERIRKFALRLCLLELQRGTVMKASQHGCLTRLEHDDSTRTCSHERGNFHASSTLHKERTTGSVGLLQTGEMDFPREESSSSSTNTLRSYIHK